MAKQTKAFCIRNFGNDRQHDTIDEVIQSCREHYRGTPIAIHCRTKTGLIRPVFVDVAETGELYESYPKGGPRRVTKETLEAVSR